MCQHGVKALSEAVTIPPSHGPKDCTRAPFCREINQKKWAPNGDGGGFWAAGISREVMGSVLSWLAEPAHTSALRGVRAIQSIILPCESSSSKGSHRPSQARGLLPISAFCQHAGKAQNPHLSVPASWESHRLSRPRGCQGLPAPPGCSEPEPGSWGEKHGDTGLMEPAQWPRAAINHVAVWAMKGAEGREHSSRFPYLLQAGLPRSAAGKSMHPSVHPCLPSSQGSQDRFLPSCSLQGTARCLGQG